MLTLGFLLLFQERLCISQAAFRRLLDNLSGMPLVATNDRFVGARASDLFTMRQQRESQHQDDPNHPTTLEVRQDLRRGDLPPTATQEKLAPTEISHYNLTDHLRCLLRFQILEMELLQGAFELEGRLFEVVVGNGRTCIQAHIERL